MASTMHQELSVFLRLAESLHFARSAKAAHMSPSALTRSIQRLEEELGHPLFQRGPRGVTLTRAGEIFRDHARAQLAGHARLLEALAAEKQAPTGELRIACTVTVLLEGADSIRIRAKGPHAYAAINRAVERIRTTAGTGLVADPISV